MNTSDVQFNIIYTPDTAALLSPFVGSLLQWSDCSYRLISNGCPEAERNILKNLAARHDRLDYLCFSESGMIEHATVLNALQTEEQGEWFCALDSDIYASGPWLDTVAELSSDSAGIFTGLPTWCISDDTILPAKFERLQGTHVALSNGTSIGSTYFMVYNNAMVNRVRKETGVGFERYRWSDLPDEHKPVAEKYGARMFDYDTAIIMNLLITERGGKITYTDLPGITHLGGLAEDRSHRSKHYFRGRLDKLSYKLRSTGLDVPLMWYADLYYGALHSPQKLYWREYQSLSSRARRRFVASSYYFDVLNALVQNKPYREVPHIGNRAVESRLKHTADELGKIFAEHNDFVVDPSMPNGSQ